MKESKDPGLYIRAIEERFEPAGNENAATHFLSTREITDAINELNPALGALPEDTYNALCAAGFMFKSPGGGAGIGFRWLMSGK
ncbi:MAG: hypothetical protein LBK65_10785 [Tannerellaceae bacterium]|jgi:hypothetical protein|nr:hypothetical protein [Tannerellaceae bacterium]